MNDTFSSIIIKANEGYQISVALYDGDNFVRRDGWTTGKFVYDNKYSLIINISSLTAVDQNDNKDVLKTYFQVLVDKTTSLKETVKKDKNITFHYGNRALHNTVKNRLSIVGDVYLSIDDIFVCKDGYEMTIAFSDLSWGAPTFEKAIKITSNNSYIIIFRKEDQSDFNTYDLNISDLLLIAPNNLIENIKDVKIKYDNIVNKWYGKYATFIGDSITYGVNTTVGNRYWEFLSEKCKFMANGMGVPGSCISTKSDYGTENSPLVNRWNTIPKSDLICIFAGTNDYGHNTPLGTIEDITDVSFYGALRVIVSGLINKYPSSRLAFMTPLHRYGFGDFQYDTDINSVGHNLKDYVNAIKEVCEFYSIPVIDTYSISGLNPCVEKIKELYVNDGLHPNELGHKLLAERIYTHFNNL